MSRYLHPLVALSIVFSGLLVAPATTEARSLRECERSIRVGSRLVIAGDDAIRAKKLFSQHSQWTLVRHTRRQMVWRKSGRSKRTVRLQLENGRITAVCQLD